MEKKDIAQALRALDGREVARRLAQAAALPSEGIAAGQSVASVAMEVLGIELSRPINDVDVFFNERLSPEIQARARDKATDMGKRLSALSSRVSASDSHGVANSGYSLMAMATVKDGYNLLRATREGMLNEIFYSRTRYFEDRPNDEAALVIKAFDLNCAQIGLDLKTGALAWTPEFEEFLASRELRVMNVATPFHTAARYFKKKRDLGCYGDDELNMAACALPSVMGLFGDPSEPADGRSDSPLTVGRFGKKTRDLALADSALLSPWFSVERSDTRSEIWTMRPNWSENAAVFEKLACVRPISGEDQPSPFLRAPALLVPRAANWAQACLRPRAKGLDEQLDRLDQAMAKAGCSTGLRAYYADIAKVEGPGWAQGKAASEAELRALARLAKDHRRFTGIMWGMGLKEQATAALSLKRMEQERGQKLYGWLEGQPAAACRELLMDQNKLEAFCQNQSLAGERALAPALEFKGVGALARRAAKSLLKVRFEELLTPNALDQEGKEMRHCVGGYASSVEQGRSRIFKVWGPDPADRSTLETAGFEGRTESEMEEEPAMSVIQHRAVSNQDPSERALAASEMLSSAFGHKASERPALALASALARALDAKAIPPEKMRTAERLLRLAVREAADGHIDTWRSEARAKKALERHFPKPAKPWSQAIDLAGRLGVWRRGDDAKGQEAPGVKAASPAA